MHNQNREEIRQAALFSDCKDYRYLLYRELPGLLADKGEDNCIFIMCNPSTADEKQDDPTVRKCKQFATNWGYRHLWIVNLFAYRSPNKLDLMRLEDPVGPDNNTVIEGLFDIHGQGIKVCAWGVIHPGLTWRIKDFFNRFRDEEYHALTCTHGIKPGHPLYLPYKTRLVRYIPDH